MGIDNWIFKNKSLNFVLRSFAK